MCLKTMEGKMDEGIYTSHLQIIKNFTLMMTNCLYYNKVSVVWLKNHNRTDKTIISVVIIIKKKVLMY